MDSLEIQRDEPIVEVLDEVQFNYPSHLEEGVLQVDPLSTLKGQCGNFISHNEKMTRDPIDFEVKSQKHPDRQMIACHFRNTNYAPETVRTPKALRDSLSFIVREHLSGIHSLINNTLERNRLVHFIYDRVIAIRCEYHVQGLLDPQTSLRVIKILIYLETLGNVPIRIVGLENFLLPHIKNQLIKTPNTLKIFQEALGYSIIKASRSELLEIISTHWQQIEANKDLLSILNSKQKILRGNYLQYFKELASNKDIVARMIYWNQYDKVSERAIACYKKSRMNERAGVICKILCYKKMEGWVNVSVEEQWQRLQKYKVEYDLKIKMWVGEKALREGVEAIVRLFDGDI